MTEFIILVATGMKTNGLVSSTLNVGNGKMAISIYFNQDGNLSMIGKLIQKLFLSELKILKKMKKIINELWFKSCGNEKFIIFTNTRNTRINISPFLFRFFIAWP